MRSAFRGDRLSRAAFTATRTPCLRSTVNCDLLVSDLLSVVPSQCAECERGMHFNRQTCIPHIGLTLFMAAAAKSTPFAPARSSREQVGPATSQEQPGAARSSQEQPEAAKSSP